MINIWIARRSTLVLIIYLFLQCGPAAMSLEVKEFDKAVNLLKNNDTDRAAIVFDGLISNGFATGSVYYNSGMTHLAHGKVGLAVLCHERARLFMPRLKDIESGLTMARAKMTMRDYGAKNSVYYEFIDALAGHLTLSESFAVLFLILLSGAILFWFALCRVKKYNISVLVLICTLFMGSCFSAALYRKIVYIYDTGIVVTASADVKKEPLNDSEIYFPLSDGMRVTILVNIKDWTKIKTASGKTGWVKADRLETLTW